MENNNVRSDPADSESTQSNVYSDAFRSWQAARKIFDTAVQEYATACATFEAVCSENPVGSHVNYPRREQALAALDPELPQIASNLEQVTNATKAIKVLRNRSTILSPISRLPSELLVRIFESFDYSGPPGPALEKGSWPFPESVACVSTYWRRLTLNNGQLWNRINFDLPSHLGDKLYEWAETRLKNSLGHRVELCVHGATYDEGDFKKLLGFLPQVMPRLAAIRVGSLGSIYYSAPEILSPWFTHDTHGAVTDLQLIGSGSHYFGSSLTRNQPIELIEDRFSHVRYLTLRHVLIDWSSRLYQGLVELDLLFIHGNCAPVPIGQFASVLSASPMLRALKIRGLNLRDSSPRPEPVRLDNLEILFLAQIYSGAQLLLPILQPGSKPMYVRLLLSTFDPDPCLQLLMRSRVAKLIIECDVPKAPPPALFTVLPVTQHLMLVDFQLPIEFFLSMRFPLALRDNSQYPTVWPHLRSLHLLRCWFPNNFSEQIIRRKTPIPYHFVMSTSHCTFPVPKDSWSLEDSWLPAEVKSSAREKPILQALQAYLPGAQGASNDGSPFLRLAWKSALDFGIMENMECRLFFSAR